MNIKKQRLILLLSFIIVCILCTSILCITISICSERKNEDTNYYTIIENLKNAKITEETDYYQVVYSDYLYYYCIFNSEHQVVKYDGPLNKEPHLSVVNNMVKFTLQAGTGIGTQWGYYYDIHKGIFSEVFKSIYDENQDLVVYSDVNKVIIRNIFDKKIYYKEISEFEKTFSNVAKPIIDIKFINDGKSIKITYLTGSDYQKFTEVIDLL